ncbi:MAG: zinc ABC transporter substrate-binding protein [Sphaerochaetaceae bacterium]
MYRNLKVVFMLLFVLNFFVFAQGTKDLYLTEDDISIVASTSWVGGIVEAATNQKVQVLAPVELRHPPEYDFSPNDIIKASKADLVFWAGYEGFIKNLVKAANLDENNLHLVNTNNSPDKLVVSVKNVAEILNTQKEFELWKNELDKLSSKLSENRDKRKSIKAVVQYHHKDFAQFLGYDVLFVFGPQDLTLGDIIKIEGLDADLIIDNWHSVQGESFKSGNRDYVQLINFPGPFNTSSILDVISYNAKVLGLLDNHW